MSGEKDGTSAHADRRRARLRREPGGRPHAVLVRLSDREKEQISARAEAQGVSVPRFLVESALTASPDSLAQRRMRAAEFLGVRRVVARLGTNLEEMVRAAEETGERPPGLEEALQSVVRVAARLEEAAEHLGGART